MSYSPENKCDPSIWLLEKSSQDAHAIGSGFTRG